MHSRMRQKSGKLPSRRKIDKCNEQTPPLHSLFMLPWVKEGSNEHYYYSLASTRVAFFASFVDVLVIYFQAPCCEIMISPYDSNEGMNNLVIRLQVKYSTRTCFCTLYKNPLSTFCDRLHSTRESTWYK